MATRNIVPRATGEGALGTAAKKWLSVNANNVSCDSINVVMSANGSTGNISISGGSYITAVNNASTISISGRSLATADALYPFNRRFVLAAEAGSYNKTPIFIPMGCYGDNFTIRSARVFLNRTAGTQINMSYGIGIYSQINSTSWASFITTTQAMSQTTSAQWSGTRVLDITWSNTSPNVVGFGDFIVGLWYSASNNLTNNANFQILGNDQPTIAGFLFAGTNTTAATNAASQVMPNGYGIYSVTTTGLPDNINKSDLLYGGGTQQPQIMVILLE